MPKILSQQQIERYLDQGFLSPIDVISEDEARGYHERFQAAEQEFPDQLNAENRNNPNLAFKFLDELVFHPIILDVVEDLIGADFSLWGTVLFIKEPQTSHYVSWHQDATYVGIVPHDYVSPWLALTESNLETGCMSMIPGSHRNQVQKHVDTFDQNNLLTRGQEISEVDESIAVDLILKPGQMSLHHAKVIHGSQPNNSPQRRVGFAMAYMPAGARQTIGENYWLPMRGNCAQPNFVYLNRPRYDMDPDGVSERAKANQNWANILYQGAREKRAY